MKFKICIKEHHILEKFPMDWNSQMGHPNVDTMACTLILLLDGENTIGAIYKEYDNDDEYTCCLKGFCDENIDVKVPIENLKYLYFCIFNKQLTEEMSKKMKSLNIVGEVLEKEMKKYD